MTNERDEPTTAERDERIRAAQRRAWRTFGVGLVIGTFYALFLAGQFVDAWQIWLAGKDAADAPLWGKTVLFWARVGKLVQFVAGLVVVLDLIGPDVLRAYLSRMRATRRDASERFRAARPAQSIFWEVAFVAMIVCTLPGLVVTLVRQGPWDFKLLIVVVLVWGFALVVFKIRPALFAFLRLIRSTALMSTVGLAASGVVWALDTQNPGHRVRWTGFWLFVVGFVLDLLGS